ATPLACTSSTENEGARTPLPALPSVGRALRARRRSIGASGDQRQLFTSRAAPVDETGAACDPPPSMDSPPGSMGAGLRRPTLSVIVPVYNERATIREILQRVASRPEVDELIIVDDCSKDGTGDVLREEERAGWPSLRTPSRPLPRIKLLQHEVNQGKGA